MIISPKKILLPLPLKKPSFTLTSDLNIHIFIMKENIKKTENCMLGPSSKWFSTVSKGLPIMKSIIRRGAFVKEKMAVVDTQKSPLVCYISKSQKV